MLKIRGKRKDNGEWIEGNLISRKCDGFAHNYIYDSSVDETEIYEYCENSKYPLKDLFIEVIPKTVSIYVGLFSNVDIWEHSIIVIDSQEIGGDKITGEVVFNNDQTLSNLEWGLWTKHGYYVTDFLGRITVLGNVFDNLELLD